MKVELNCLGTPKVSIPEDLSFIIFKVMEDYISKQFDDANIVKEKNAAKF